MLSGVVLSVKVILRFHPATIFNWLEWAKPSTVILLTDHHTPSPRSIFHRQCEWNIGDLILMSQEILGLAPPGGEELPPRHIFSNTRDIFPQSFVL